jgi:putative membrane protein insertion efficiency factor
MNLPQHILILAIRVYRWTISPAQIFLFGANAGCRFTPTCSEYAIEAVRARGAISGSGLAAKRICRCHPFGGCGHDPVPQGEFKIQNSKFKIAEFVR